MQGTALLTYLLIVSHLLLSFAGVLGALSVSQVASELQPQPELNSVHFGS